jgi:hypothetical protein
MPDHKIHEMLDVLLLGKPYPVVHDFLDMYQQALQSRHRVLLHDEAGIAEVFYGTGDIMAAWSAYYHIMLDEVSDKVGQAAALPVLLDILGIRLVAEGV